MKRSRLRDLSVRLVAMLVIGVLLRVNVTPAVGADRPNVILIVSDDHGWGDVGWNNPAVPTPNLHRLADEGVRLDRFYSNPICSVTRAALMTGMATLRTGVNNRRGLDLRYRLMPEAFRDAGYQTWMCGKWHLGGSPDNQFSGAEYLPQARGFDYFYGFVHGAIDYYTHERKDLGELDWQRNGKPVREDGFTTDLLTRDAVDRIQQRDRSRPFLLYLAFNAIHGPLQPPPGEASVSRRDRRGLLLANLRAMDDAVGRLMEVVKQEGLERDTLVLFFGDNGGQLNQGASNGSLRGEKGGTFEGGIRVPAVVRWTGKLPERTVSQQFLSVMDVFPTICSATGIASGVRQPMDGVDLWNALVSGKTIERPPMVLGTRDVASVAPPWKLVLPGRGEQPLLFDIVADPDERNDVAATHPEIVDRLQQVVLAMERTAGGREGGRGRGGRRRASDSRPDETQGTDQRNRDRPRRDETRRDEPRRDEPNRDQRSAGGVETSEPEDRSSDVVDPGLSERAADRTRRGGARGDN